MTVTGIGPFSPYLTIPSQIAQGDSFSKIADRRTRPHRVRNRVVIFEGVGSKVHYTATNKASSSSQ